MMLLGQWKHGLTVDGGKGNGNKYLKVCYHEVELYCWRTFGKHLLVKTKARAVETKRFSYVRSIYDLPANVDD
jgi:hypothetical protein